jgi:hypothetical protein
MVSLSCQWIYLRAYVVYLCSSGLEWECLWHLEILGRLVGGRSRGMGSVVGTLLNSGPMLGMFPFAFISTN